MKSKRSPNRPPPNKPPSATTALAAAHASPRGEKPGTLTRQRAVLAGLLVALIVVAYFPALDAGFVWDDNLYVSENATLTSLEGLWKIWFSPRSLPQYYPLVYTTFWIEYHVWGLHPLGYHAVNIALQVICTLLLWRLLERLHVPGAWLAAAIFAVHPVQVESVTWITERKNVLSMALALGSVLSYLRFSPPEVVSTARRTAQQWRYYALSLALFGLALLSKTAVTPLPGALLVIEWWKRGRLGWRQIWPTLPLFALSAAAGAMTVWVEHTVVQAVGSEYERNPLERILVAGRALWFYAGKLAWPHPIITFYPRWDVDARVGWQYLFPIAAAAVIVGLWLARKKIGRGPLAAVLIFTGMLVPALGFFTIYFTRYSYVADHFQYHASPALIALAVAAVTVASARWSAAVRWGAALASAMVLALFVGLTFLQSRVYHDVDTYYRDVIAKNPDGATVAYLNLSLHLANDGRFEEALEMARTRLRLTPENPKVLRALGEILVARGEREGFNAADLNEAMEVLTKAVKLDPSDTMARGQLGRAFLESNHVEDARLMFQYLVDLDANNAPALFGLGVVAQKSGRTGDAIAFFQRAIQARPNYAKAHHALGVLFADTGQFDKAVPELSTAVELQPSWPEAHYDLGNAFVRQGKLLQATQQYEIALTQRPDFVDARINLGVALGQAGELDQAIAQFEEVLRLDPAHLSARNNLASAFEKQRELAAPPKSEQPTP